jgi:hypothetical protein
MQEEFRPIKNYEGLYEISNFGRVKNLISGKILKNTLNKTTGYYVVKLSKNDKLKMKLIHVLIAQAFLPNPANKQKVDHIDRDTKNNNIDNLRWVTSSQNRMNSSKSSVNTSGFSGVSFCKRYKIWRARIMIDGKEHSKTFNTIEEAIEYRLELEQKHFGIYSPNYKPPIINNYITNNITNNIQTVKTLINQVVKSEQQQLEELEKEFEQAMK